MPKTSGEIAFDKDLLQGVEIPALSELTDPWVVSWNAFRKHVFENVDMDRTNVSTVQFDATYAYASLIRVALRPPLLPGENHDLTRYEARVAEGPTLKGHKVHTDIRRYPKAFQVDGLVKGEEFVFEPANLCDVRDRFGAEYLCSMQQRTHYSAQLLGPYLEALRPYDPLRAIR